LTYLEVSHRRGIKGYAINRDTVFAYQSPTQEKIYTFTLTYCKE